jgi:hypothetical protein
MENLDYKRGTTAPSRISVDDAWHGDGNDRAARQRRLGAISVFWSPSARPRVLTDLAITGEAARLEKTSHEVSSRA